jgi:hypothetical protein
MSYAPEGATGNVNDTGWPQLHGTCLHSASYGYINANNLRVQLEPYSLTFMRLSTIPVLMGAYVHASIVCSSSTSVGFEET